MICLIFDVDYLFSFVGSLTVQGNIRANCHPIDAKFMRENSGYMHQEDIFIETMTVSEHLWFTVIYF